MPEILHKKLSYQIIGALFQVFNTLGYGYREQYYQKALTHEFDKLGLLYKKEVVVPLIYGDKKVGNYRLDFLIDDRIVLELKIASRFFVQDSKQIYSYLKAAGKQLGILAIIHKGGIKYKRIIHRI